MLPTSTAARITLSFQEPAVFTSRTGVGQVRNTFQSSGVSRAFFSGLSGMLLDHQTAAFGLLHRDDGFMQAAFPGLFGGDAIAIRHQRRLEHAEHGAVVVLAVADQQVQMSLGHAGNQFGALEREAFRVLGFKNHQNAANGLHDRDLRKVRTA
jgi:hypothetical protein